MISADMIIKNENHKALDRIEQGLIRMETKYRKQMAAIQSWGSITSKEEDRHNKHYKQLRKFSKDFKNVLLGTDNQDDNAE